MNFWYYYNFFKIIWITLILKLQGLCIFCMSGEEIKPLHAMYALCHLLMLTLRAILRVIKGDVISSLSYAKVYKSNSLPKVCHQSSVSISRADIVASVRVAMNKRIFVLTVSCVVFFCVEKSECRFLHRRAVRNDVEEPDDHSRTETRPPHLGHRIARSLLHASGLIWNILRIYILLNLVVFNTSINDVIKFTNHKVYKSLRFFLKYSC